jgi:hypothetical protein
MVRFPAKARDFFSSEALKQPGDPFSLLLTYRAVKPWLKISILIPPVPHTPSRRAGEKRYLLPAYFFITVLSNRSKTYFSKSVSSAFKYNVRYNGLYGFFFWYAYNFLVLECSDYIIFILFQVGWMFIYSLPRFFFINRPRNVA